MRHKKAGKQLSRNSSHRRALFRNMVTSLFEHERIETTDAKAKAIRPLAEKMITLAKRGDLHARRQAMAFLQDKVVAHRLFNEIKDRYLERQGGYLRIVKKGQRKGDGAPVSIVQLLTKEEGKKTRKKGKKTEGAKAKASKSKKPEAVKKTEKEKQKEDQKTPGDELQGEKKNSGMETGSGAKSSKTQDKGTSSPQKSEVE